jgi:hypothetical protein
MNHTIAVIVIHFHFTKKKIVQTPISNKYTRSYASNLLLELIKQFLFYGLRKYT